MIQPKDKNELIKLIKDEIDKNGLSCDLNHIDTSLITDMSHLFSDFDTYGLKNFNGNISKWNTSNVTNMSHMFQCSQFNQDISHWNTSNVTDISHMFSNSIFNKNISKWNTSSVINMSYMFYQSQFNQDISQWDTSNVTDMAALFSRSKFNQDISNWNTSNVTNMSWMFSNSVFNQDISLWDTSNVTSMCYMFSKSNFNKNINTWNVSNVLNFYHMFEKSKFNKSINSWKLNSKSLFHDDDHSQFNKLQKKTDISLYLRKFFKLSQSNKLKNIHIISNPINTTQNKMPEKFENIFNTIQQLQNQINNSEEIEKISCKINEIKSTYLSLNPSLEADKLLINSLEHVYQHLMEIKKQELENNFSQLKIFKNSLSQKIELNKESNSTNLEKNI